MRLLLGLAAALIAGAAAAAPVDLIIRGGPIYTGVADHPTAKVVTVVGGRIGYVGDGETVRFETGPNTRVIDLKGAALFPGFTDSHAHLRGIGERELTLNPEGSRSAAEVARRLGDYIAAHKPQGLVFGRGWIETGWPEGRFLDRADIDPVAPD